MTSDPNAGWWIYAINSTLQIGASLALGGLSRHRGRRQGGLHHAQHVRVAASAYGGSRLWIINKVPTYAGPNGNIAAAVYDPFTSSASVLPPPRSRRTWVRAGTGGALGTYLVSYSGLNAAASRRRVHPGGNPRRFWSSCSRSLVGNIDSNAAQNDALQLGTTRRIETNDRRRQNAVWRNGEIFLAANCMPAAGADVGE